MKRVLWAGVAATIATTAFAASTDYYENHGVTLPHTWTGQDPAMILLIQDRPGWGFDAHIQILTGCGIPYDVINSGGIARANFANYDKIITAGQQPDSYYVAIQAHSAKFTDYMSQGGCVAFETANYFGGANERITWPGGFTAAINQGSNVLVMDDADNCVLNDVPSVELQRWGYSAHGIHTNLSASYVSYLSTVDGSPNGSCAGYFAYGMGGAYLSHQPLEWAYGFGYSNTYPRNFDCCFGLGSTGPVDPVDATRPSSWGAVKTLFR